jgi:hypothetical protein
MTAIMVLDKQATAATSTVVTIANIHTGSPADGSNIVNCPNGWISVQAENSSSAGSHNAELNVEWSPDGVSWFLGSTITPLSTSTTMSTKDVLVAHNTGGEVVETPQDVSDLDATTSTAQAFRVKGRYVRVNMTVSAGTPTITVWIDGV